MTRTHAAARAPARSTRLELRTWRWALVFFLIAAATGAWMRFGLAFGWPPLLRFDDMRHAHSHLMFFGWVTPVLFACIARVADRAGGRMRGIGWLLAGTFAAAALAYPAFLSSGYRLTTLFGRDLPLSMAAAGLSGVAWTAFAAIYLRARWRMRADAAARHPAALAWFDAAVFLLAASLLGIAGLAAGGMLGASDPQLTGGLVDFFLALFGEGWFGAAILGLGCAAAVNDGEDGGVDASAVPSESLPLVFAAGTLTWTVAELGLQVAGRPIAPVWLASAEGASLLRVFAAMGHVVVGVAIGWTCIQLLRSPKVRTVAAGSWLPALGFLAVKGVVELGFVVPGIREAAAAGGMRVLLLHAFLLGAVSVGLVAARGTTMRARTPGARLWTWAFVGSVILLLTGLAPLAGLTPWLPAGVWTLQLAAVTGLGPVIAATGLWAVAAREPT